MLRRFAFSKNLFKEELFPEPTKQPTFCQYLPELFYFEQHKQDLICSARSGIPLVRYDLKDYGGLISLATVREKLSARGHNLNELVKQAKIENTLWNLPFVYVYERNNFSVSYYAFLIYPDTVRKALQITEIEDKVTSKFTMSSDYSREGRQKLYIHVELKHGVLASPRLKRKIREIIHEQLFVENSEYRETFTHVKDKIKPVIYLHPYEDTAYFKPGTKQRWVIK